MCVAMACVRSRRPARFRVHAQAPAAESSLAVAAAARAIAYPGKQPDKDGAEGRGELLSFAPHARPFDERVRVFRQMVVEDRRRAGVRVQAGGIDAGDEDIMQAGPVIKARAARCHRPRLLWCNVGWRRDLAAAGPFAHFAGDCEARQDPRGRPRVSRPPGEGTLSLLRSVYGVLTRLARVRGGAHADLNPPTHTNPPPRPRPQGPALKGRVFATFRNAAGAMEAGIDAGGLFKELLTDVARAVLNPERGLFSSTADGLLYPALQAAYLPDGLRLLEFAGLIVGKARGGGGTGACALAASGPPAPTRLNPRVP